MKLTAVLEEGDTLKLGKQATDDMKNIISALKFVWEGAKPDRENGERAI